MQAILLAVHLILTLAMITVILIQRSEGGGLGMGGGNMGGLMSARGTANLLTRTTAILAGCFICTSLVLAIMARYDSQSSSILDNPNALRPAPVTAPASPAEPEAPPAE